MRTTPGLTLFYLLLFATAAAACPPSTATSLGGALVDHVYDAALDPQGRLVITGSYFNAPLEIPGLPPVANAGGEDVLLAVFDATGDPVWAKGFGLSNAQIGLAVEADASGNIVLAGLLLGSVDFGGGVLSSGDYASFLAKFDASGNHLWSQIVSSEPFVTGVTVASGGDIALVTGGLSPDDIFLYRFDTAGSLLHAAQYGTRFNTDAGGDVAVTSDGDVILTGYVEASTPIGSFVAPAGDAFVARIDPAGVVQWLTSWGGSDSESPEAVAVAPDGSIYFGGSFSSADAPGLTGGPHQGGSDWFLGKLSDTGSLQWIRNGGGPRRDAVFGIGVTSSGDPVVTGSTRNPFSEDEHLFVAQCTAGNQDVFEIEFHDVAGGDDIGRDVVVDGNGDLIVVGSYEGTLDLCGEVLTSLGDSDGFLFRMGAPGPVSVPEPATGFNLEQNRPNPFNPSTTIRYRVASPGGVRLDVYDARGRHVRRLVDRAHAAGDYQVEWKGRDDAGRELASGVYRVRLVAGAHRAIRAMVLVR